MASKTKSSSQKGTTPKLKKEVPVKVKKEKKPEVKLLTYSVRATIPTMAFGNISPEIVVEAKTLEDARAVVMPEIEALFETYLEEPRDGRTARFMKKASVEVTQREVTPEDVTIKKSEPAPVVDKKEEEEKPLVIGEKTPAYLKAESAINGASTKEALDVIEEQVKKSVKLTESEKPLLMREVLLKRKTFN